MSWFGGLLGQREVSASADILLERLQDSAKVDDRRKTIADLKAVVNENHLSIGKSIKALVNVLKADRQDIDIIRDVVEIFIAIMVCSPGKDNTVELANSEDFVKDFNNVAILLGLLEEKDYYVRYYTTQLVTTLLTNKSDELQTAILQSPMGISRLMDLLLDPREIVRNEALLLLLELTKSNQEIQKIVAFEGAFERLLDIIRDEGAAEGGIIVQDCLRLVNNLLRNNVSNQNYFRETNCVKRLTPLLEVQNSDMWILTDNKFNILILTLNLISLLIAGNNPSTYSNQTVLAQNGIINLIVRLALGKMSAVAVRSKALYTLGDMVRGHMDNLNALAAISLLNEATKQVQPSLLKLVLVLLNAKDISERLAALHTIQCYLFGNEEGQVAIASTITPGGDETVSNALPPTTTPPPPNGTGGSGLDAVQAAAASAMTIGGHLLRALLGWQNSSAASPDPLPSWLAACAIAAIFKDNAASKELVLRIPLELPKQGLPMVTLMTKTMRAFIQAERSGADILIKVGLLRILCVWLDQSPASVKSFLSTSTNLPFLVELLLQPIPPNNTGTVHVQGLSALLIGLCFQFNEDDAASEFNRSALHSIIMHRVGVDKYIGKLDALRKSEDFTIAEQGKALDPDNPSIKFYDYDFSIFYKDAYDKIQRQIRAPIKPKPVVVKRPPATNPDVYTPSAPISVQSTSTASPHHTSPAVQDQQPANATALTPTLTNTSHPHARHDASHDPVITSYKELIRSQDRELESIKKENESLRNIITTRDSELTATTNELAALRLAPSIPQQQQLQQPASIDPAQVEAMTALSQAYNELEELANRKDDEINQLKKQIEALRSSSLLPAAPTLSLVDDEEDFASTILQGQISNLTADMAATARQRDETLQQLNTLRPQMEQLHAQVTSLQAQVQSLQQQNTQLHTQVQEKEKMAASGKQSPVMGDARDLKISKLEMQLREAGAKYGALEKEQEELLSVLANTELQNNNLQERIRIYEMRTPQ